MNSCTQCAGQLTYHPGSDAFQCESCGSSTPWNKQAKPVDLPLLSALLSSPPPLVEARAQSCTSCGAITHLPPGVAAGTCPFCGNTLGSSQSLHPRVDPTHVLPFRIGKAAACECIATWSESRARITRWTDHLPTIERSELLQAHMEAVYLPFWMFLPPGGTKMHALEIVSMQAPNRPVPIPAQIPHYNGKAFPRQELYALEPWPLAEALPFDPAFTRQIPIEAAQHELSAAWSDFQGTVAFYDAFLEHVGGGVDVQNLSHMNPVERMVNHQVGAMPLWKDILQNGDIRVAQVLLPVWICNVIQNSRKLRIFINATSGEVVFDARTLPNSNAKIATGASSTLGDAAATITHRTQMPSGIAMGCLMVAAAPIGAFVGGMLGLFLAGESHAPVLLAALGFIAGPILAAIASSSIMQGGARKKGDDPLGLMD